MEPLGIQCGMLVGVALPIGNNFRFVPLEYMESLRNPAGVSNAASSIQFRRILIFLSIGDISMTLAETFHAPPAELYLCPDCGQVGNQPASCPGCTNQCGLMNLSTILNRRNNHMITFNALNTTGFNPPSLPVQVILDGKIVGLIRKTTNGFTYYPKGAGSKNRGEEFSTLEECKASLIER